MFSLCSSLFPGFRKQTCSCSIKDSAGAKGAVPGLDRRLAAIEMAPECRWFGMPVSGIMGGVSLVYKAVLPLAQLHLGTSWEPVALLDGTIRAREHLVVQVL